MSNLNINLKSTIAFLQILSNLLHFLWLNRLELNRKYNDAKMSVTFLTGQSLKTYPNLFIVVFFLTIFPKIRHNTLGCRDFHFNISTPGKLRILALKWHPTPAWWIFSHFRHLGTNRVQSPFDGINSIIKTSIKSVKTCRVLAEIVSTRCNYGWALFWFNGLYLGHSI